MKTTPVTTADLTRSVFAVPPLCRDAEGRLVPAANRAILQHLAAGGITNVMYGGNANLYNMAPSEYPAFLDMIEALAPADAWMLPSVGPDYGKACDQIDLLKSRRFPTAMILPLRAPTRPQGVATGIRRLADRLGRPLIAYVNADGYATAGDLGRLVRDGTLIAVKYGTVRNTPADDSVLRAIVDAAGADRVVSGIGERPVIEHFTVFGLRAFTSGCVCVAPRLSMAILRALQKGDVAAARRLRESFLPLEDERDGQHPIAVLHEAVRLAGIADTGPLGPTLGNITEAADLERIRAAAVGLFAANERALQVAA